jgi:Ca2+-binding EF-hand superfamily protein
LISAAALIPAFAFAQGATAPAGTTTPSAKAQKLEARFVAADKNGDGALTRAEVDAAGMKRVSKNFDAIDANKDGKVTRAELAAFRAAHKDEHRGS